MRIPGVVRHGRVRSALRWAVALSCGWSAIAACAGDPALATQASVRRYVVTERGTCVVPHPSFAPGKRSCQVQAPEGVLEIAASGEASLRLAERASAAEPSTDRFPPTT